ncbi:MAG: hypothetical protein HY752_03505 [Nitrospirae bacterium]|nr:hypothetical protein [Nitrospirota bacterium]
MVKIFRCIVQKADKEPFKGVRNISQKELIDIDDSGRKALKNTVYAGRQIS